MNNKPQDDFCPQAQPALQQLTRNHKNCVNITLGITSFNLEKSPNSESNLKKNDNISTHTGPSIPPNHSTNKVD